MIIGSRRLLAGFEGERGGVDAVALAGGAGAVVEDVPEVPPTAAATHLGAAHEEAVVGAQLDRLGDRRLGERGPAAVPESNLVSDPNSSAPQPAQL